MIRSTAYFGALCAAFMAVATSAAGAYEYPLVFTPSGNYQDLHIAGYQISGKTVTGDCSYTQVTSGSGRDPHTTYTPVPLTCSWTYSGTLLGTVSGAPAAPNPIATNGTQIVYSAHGSGYYAGIDSAYSTGGFVSYRGSHYNFLTSNAYQVLPPGPYSFTALVQSNGDTPLNITSIRVSNTLANTKATINSNSCAGALAPGATCAVSVTYNFPLIYTPSGLAYDTLTIHLSTDAIQTNDFVQGYTLEVHVGGG